MEILCVCAHAHARVSLCDSSFFSAVSVSVCACVCVLRACQKALGRVASARLPCLFFVLTKLANTTQHIYIYIVYKHTFYISNRHLKDLVGSARHFGAKYLHDHKKHTIYIYTYIVTYTVCSNYIGRYNEKQAAKGSACQTNVSPSTRQDTTAIKKMLEGGKPSTSMASTAENVLQLCGAKRNSKTKQIPRATTTYT